LEVLECSLQAAQVAFYSPFCPQDTFVHLS
jgi:hypothetical protein